MPSKGRFVAGAAAKEFVFLGAWLHRKKKSGIPALVVCVGGLGLSFVDGELEIPP